jgi:deazaflavin-dependent oxidoreductase (nitroreductase family)
VERNAVDRVADAQAALTRTVFRTLNSVVQPAVRAGAGNPLPVGGGAIVLETTGRVSGEPRRVPLVATRVGGRLAVSTVRGDSQWLRNIETNPNVTVHLGGEPRSATATVRRGALNTVLLSLD